MARHSQTAKSNGLTLTPAEARLLKHYRAMSTKNQKFVSAFAAATAEADSVPAPHVLVIDGERAA